jgi:hypothetical protein
MGDFIEIIGKRKTAAKVFRASNEDEGRVIISIDGMIRSNAGVSIGEKVTVVRADTQPAVKVVVAPKIPPGKRVRFGPGVEELFKKGLTNRPLVKGDAMIIPNIALMGGFLPFMVISTQPAGVVVVGGHTELVVKTEPMEATEATTTAVTYDDVGGLEDELKRVREIIELPLKHPELFDPDQYGQGLVRFQLAAPESWGFTLSGFAGTSEPGVYEPVFGPGADRTDREYRFTLDAAREPVDVLTWELWDDDDPAVRKRLKQTYERAGSSFEEIVNELVIAGAYRDQRGRKYRFNRDGTAACDGKEFEYGDLMPDTNSPYAPVDLIDVLGSTYKYKWMNGKFYLYRDISNEFENEEPVFSRKPDIVLTPVSE